MKRTTLALFALFLFVGIATAFSPSGSLIDSHETTDAKVEWHLVSQNPTGMCYDVKVSSALTNADVKFVYSAASFDLRQISTDVKELRETTRTVAVPQACTFKRQTELYIFKPCAEINATEEQIDEKILALGKDVNLKDQKACVFIYDAEVTEANEKECGTKDIQEKVEEWLPITFSSAKSISIREDVCSVKQTYPGYKWYNVCFKTPLDVPNMKWGSSGKVALWLNGIEYHPWWNATWNFRREINFTANGSSTDLPLIFQLNTTNFNYSKVASDLSDIRITDSAGTPLHFYIESVNITGTSIIRALDTAVEDGVNTYYIYYNASVATASDPTFMAYGKQSANNTALYLPFGKVNDLPSPAYVGSVAPVGDSVYIIGAETTGTHKIMKYNFTSGVWTGAVPSADFGVRNLGCMVDFNGSLWMMGGYSDGAQTTYHTNYYNCSYAGSCSVVSNTTITPFPRSFLSCEVMNNTLYVMAGYHTSGGDKADTWSTTDGLAWTLLNSSGFSARRGQATTVFDNKIWMVGGYHADYEKDVWNTADGITWTQVTTDGGYTARYGAMFSHNDTNLFIGGGEYSGGNTHDMYKSTNGTFTIISTDTGWPIQFFGKMFYSNATGKVYKYSGFSATNPYMYESDLWWSTNGSTWTNMSVINDHTGNNNPKIYSKASFSQSTTGYIGGAFKESVGSDYDNYINRVAIPNHADLNTANLTINFWIKASNAQTYQEIYEHASNGGWGDGYVVWGGTGGMTDDCIAFYSKSYGVSVYADNVLDNTWHYVSITDESAPAQKIYIDGLLINTSTQTPNARSTNVLSIGYSWHGGGRMAGTMDEVIHYKVALNSTQILTLFHTYNASLYTWGTEEGAIPDVNITGVSPAVNTTFYTATFNVNATTNIGTNCSTQFNGAGNWTLISNNQTTHTSANYTTQVGSMNVSFNCTDGLTSDLKTYEFQGDLPITLSAIPINGSNITATYFWFNATTNKNANCTITNSLFVNTTDNLTEHDMVLLGNANPFNVSIDCVTDTENISQVYEYNTGAGGGGATIILNGMASGFSLYSLLFVIGPLAAALMFAYISTKLDGEKNPVMKLLFLFSALAALLIFLNISQTVSLYGMVVPDQADTTFNYNGTLVASANTTLNYTHISPMVASDYDMVWLVVSSVIWLVLIYVVLQLFAFGFSFIHKLFFKKDEGLDEIG